MPICHVACAQAQANFRASRADNTSRNSDSASASGLSGSELSTPRTANSYRNSLRWRLLAAQIILSNGAFDPWPAVLVEIATQSCAGRHTLIASHRGRHALLEFDHAAGTTGRYVA